MGNRGRFGKYGEKKRIERLNQARLEKIAHRGIRTPVPGSARKRGRPVEMTLRPARPSDADFIRDLSRKAFHKYGSYEFLLPRWFLSGSTMTTIVLWGKRRIGYAMFARIRPDSPSPRVSELLAIAVEPGARRQGAGDLLLKESLEKAREEGIDTLILHTAMDNLPGQALFRKHGFKPARVKESFYPEGQNALAMVKDL